MGTTIRNMRPSVLHIPDAGLRLEPGQTRVVAALSPQTEALLAVGALMVVPVAAAPTAAPDQTRPDTVPAAGTSAEPASSTPADGPAPDVRTPGRRGSRPASPSLPISSEAADDTC